MEYCSWECMGLDSSCLRIKEWGKAYQGEFGTQALSTPSGILSFPAQWGHDTAEIEGRQEQKEAADSVCISIKQVSRWREPGSSWQPQEKQCDFSQHQQQALWSHPALLPAPPCSAREVSSFWG